LGRFTQPDTVLPEPGDPQQLNRFAYVRNNPLRFTDSTGHRIDPGGDQGLPKPTQPPPPPPPPPPSFAPPLDAILSRSPDYIALDVSAWVVNVNVTVDSALNLYVAPGWTKGASMFPVTAQFVMGWLCEQDPTPGRIQNFLEGDYVSISEGAVVGGGSTVSRTGVAVEVGVYFPPQVSMTAGHAWHVGQGSFVAAPSWEPGGGSLPYTFEPPGGGGGVPTVDILR